MNADAPVYLDYAATSAIRPDAVIDAVGDYLRGIGATPGRAGHRRAVEAGRVVFRCRRALAELFNLPGDPGRLTFQLNATHALNVALLGLLRSGDRVVRTAYDHNAVRRPVNALMARGVRQTVLRGAPDGSVDLDEAARALAGNGEPARLLVITHANNVLGTALPVAELAALAHDVGALVLVDAAQSAGHLPIDVQAMGIDLLAFTGHKGLLGPQGTGGLWAREGVEVGPTFFGGTGGDSDSPDMPELLPDRLEAGSQNGPGIAGLLAGVQWVMERGVPALHARESLLKLRLWYALDCIAGITVLSPPAPDGVGIVTIAAAAMDAAELATRLDREAGVLVRAGLHCAPEQHDLLGTGRTGAVRFSIGWATTEDEVDWAAAAVARIAGAAEPGPEPAGS
ncbi:aminotransferase class V-fold PLP-dependent enzyme [Longimicrobium terrae]|uniref:Cysteine desulfurase family protein n=1 Tax=Longimicrobium terrae TaxID=1639882 RepID=A0A841GJ73_9BACT|nr:aminotransferase class V-fold PLP-dependent enzyme [Longimicrobium terrae]MBB4634389.1 cysteine desulfurase family protein [Longimicrobium terrae]MBB6068721.1 cysteine desulfurase family protein [Longimicrobium terrae]NNC27907.1 aminotransferase class V-fold PLP-dependent enzyme [Longimicrobium terrae]